MALVPVHGQSRLLLEANTAEKYKQLRIRVHERSQKWLFITEPYGANRTYEQQAWLRSQWEKGVAGFFYAADPDTPQANHLKGCAFDLNNWASVGQAVITEEAKRLGLVRDPSEPWHWNNPEGIQLVLAGGSSVVPLADPAETRRLQQALVDYGLEVVVDGDYGTGTTAAVRELQEDYGLVVDGRAGVNTWKALEDSMRLTEENLRAIAKAVLEADFPYQGRTIQVSEALGHPTWYGDRFEEKLNALPAAVWGERLQHPLAVDSDGKPAMLPAADFVRYAPAADDQTRRVILDALRVVTAGDVDEKALADLLVKSGLNAQTFARAAADEADRRDRERLASKAGA